MSEETIQKLQGLLRIEDNLDFFDALIDLGRPNRARSKADFERLPEIRRMLILARAFWMAITLSNLQGFLEEKVCGAYVDELEGFMKTVGANRTANLLAKLQQAFPNGAVPKEEDQRHEFLIMLEEASPHLMESLLAEYRQQPEDLVISLRGYLYNNMDSVVVELEQG